MSSQHSRHHSSKNGNKILKNKSHNENGSSPQNQSKLLTKWRRMAILYKIHVTSNSLINLIKLKESFEDVVNLRKYITLKRWYSKFIERNTFQNEIQKIADQKKRIMQVQKISNLWTMFSRQLIKEIRSQNMCEAINEYENICQLRTYFYKWKTCSRYMENREQLRNMWEKMTKTYVRLLITSKLESARYNLDCLEKWQNFSEQICHLNTINKAIIAKERIDMRLKWSTLVQKYHLVEKISILMDAQEADIKAEQWRSISRKLKKLNDVETAKEYLIRIRKAEKIYTLIRGVKLLALKNSIEAELSKDKIQQLEKEKKKLFYFWLKRAQIKAGTRIIIKSSFDEAIVIHIYKTQDEAAKTIQKFVRETITPRVANLKLKQNTFLTWMNLPRIIALDIIEIPQFNTPVKINVRFGVSRFAPIPTSALESVPMLLKRIEFQEETPKRDLFSENTLQNNNIPGNEHYSASDSKEEKNIEIPINNQNSQNNSLNGEENKIQSDHKSECHTETQSKAQIEIQSSSFVESDNEQQTNPQIDDINKIPDEKQNDSQSKDHIQSKDNEEESPPFTRTEDHLSGDHYSGQSETQSDEQSDNEIKEELPNPKGDSSELVHVVLDESAPEKKLLIKECRNSSDHEYDKEENVSNVRDFPTRPSTPVEAKPLIQFLLPDEARDIIDEAFPILISDVIFDAIECIDSSLWKPSRLEFSDFVPNITPQVIIDMSALVVGEHVPEWLPDFLILPHESEEDASEKGKESSNGNSTLCNDDASSPKGNENDLSQGSCDYVEEEEEYPSSDSNHSHKSENVNTENCLYQKVSLEGSFFDDVLQDIVPAITLLIFEADFGYVKTPKPKIELEGLLNMEFEISIPNMSLLQITEEIIFESTLDISFPQITLFSDDFPHRFLMEFLENVVQKISNEILCSSVNDIVFPFYIPVFFDDTPSINFTDITIPIMDNITRATTDGIVEIGEFINVGSIMNSVFNFIYDYPKSLIDEIFEESASNVVDWHDNPIDISFKDIHTNVFKTVELFSVISMGSVIRKAISEVEMQLYFNMDSVLPNVFNCLLALTSDTIWYVFHKIEKTNLEVLACTRFIPHNNDSSFTLDTDSSFMLDSEENQREISRFAEVQSQTKSSEIDSSILLSASSECIPSEGETLFIDNELLDTSNIMDAIASFIRDAIEGAPLENIILKKETSCESDTNYFSLPFFDFPINVNSIFEQLLSPLNSILEVIDINVPDVELSKEVCDSIEEFAQSSAEEMISNEINKIRILNIDDLRATNSFIDGEVLVANTGSFLTWEPSMEQIILSCTDYSSNIDSSPQNQEYSQSHSEVEKIDENKKESERCSMEVHSIPDLNNGEDEIPEEEIFINGIDLPPFTFIETVVSELASQMASLEIEEPKISSDLSEEKSEKSHSYLRNSDLELSVLELDSSSNPMDTGNFIETIGDLSSSENYFQSFSERGENSPLKALISRFGSPDKEDKLNKLIKLSSNIGISESDSSELKLQDSCNATFTEQEVEPESIPKEECYVVDSIIPKIEFIQNFTTSIEQEINQIEIKDISYINNQSIDDDELDLFVEQGTLGLLEFFFDEGMKLILIPKEQIKSEEVSKKSEETQESIISHEIIDVNQESMHLSKLPTELEDSNSISLDVISIDETSIADAYFDESIHSDSLQNQPLQNIKENISEESIVEATDLSYAAPSLEVLSFDSIDAEPIDQSIGIFDSASLIENQSDGEIIDDYLLDEYLNLRITEICKEDIKKCLDLHVIPLPQITHPYLFISAELIDSSKILDTISTNVFESFRYQIDFEDLSHYFYPNNFNWVSQMIANNAIYEAARITNSTIRNAIGMSPQKTPQLKPKTRPSPSKNTKMKPKKKKPKRKKKDPFIVVSFDDLTNLFTSNTIGKLVDITHNIFKLIKIVEVEETSSELPSDEPEEAIFNLDIFSNAIINLTVKKMSTLASNIINEASKTVNDITQKESTTDSCAVMDVLDEMTDPFKLDTTLSDGKPTTIIAQESTQDKESDPEPIEITFDEVIGKEFTTTIISGIFSSLQLSLYEMSVYNIPNKLEMAECFEFPPGFSEWLTRTYQSVSARVVTKFFVDIQPEYPIDISEIKGRQEKKEKEILQNIGIPEYLPSMLDDAIINCVDIQNVFDNIVIPWFEEQKEEEEEVLAEINSKPLEVVSIEENAFELPAISILDQPDIDSIDPDTLTMPSPKPTRKRSQHPRTPVQHTPPSFVLESDDDGLKMEAASFARELPDESDRFLITLDDTFGRLIDNGPSFITLDTSVLEGLINTDVVSDTSFISEEHLNPEDIEIPEAWDLSMSSAPIIISMNLIGEIFNNMIFPVEETNIKKIEYISDSFDNDHITLSLDTTYDTISSSMLPDNSFDLSIVPDLIIPSQEMKDCPFGPSDIEIPSITVEGCIAPKVIPRARVDDKLPTVPVVNYNIPFMGEEMEKFVFPDELKFPMPPLSIFGNSFEASPPICKHISPNRDAIDVVESRSPTTIEQQKRQQRPQRTLILRETATSPLTEKKITTDDISSYRNLPEKEKGINLRTKNKKSKGKSSLKETKNVGKAGKRNPRKNIKKPLVLSSQEDDIESDKEPTSEIVTIGELNPLPSDHEPENFSVLEDTTASYEETSESYEEVSAISDQGSFLADVQSDLTNESLKNSADDIPGSPPPKISMKKRASPDEKKSPPRVSFTQELLSTQGSKKKKKIVKKKKRTILKASINPTAFNNTLTPSFNYAIKAFVTHALKLNCSFLLPGFIDNQPFFKYKSGSPSLLSIDIPPPPSVKQMPTKIPSPIAPQSPPQKLQPNMPPPLLGSPSQSLSKTQSDDPSLPPFVPNIPKTAPKPEENQKKTKKLESDGVPDVLEMDTENESRFEAYISNNSSHSPIKKSPPKPQKKQVPKAQPPKAQLLPEMTLSLMKSIVATIVDSIESSIPDFRIATNEIQNISPKFPPPLPEPISTQSASVSQYLPPVPQPLSSKMTVEPVKKAKADRKKPKEIEEELPPPPPLFLAPIDHQNTTEENPSSLSTSSTSAISEYRVPAASEMLLPQLDVDIPALRQSISRPLNGVLAGALQNIVQKSLNGVDEEMKYVDVAEIGVDMNNSHQSSKKTGKKRESILKPYDAPPIEPLRRHNKKHGRQYDITKIVDITDRSLNNALLSIIKSSK